MLLPPGPARRKAAKMKLQLHKTGVSGTKRIRATKSDLHGTPTLIPIRAQGRQRTLPLALRAHVNTAAMMVF